jgi:4-hydroxy-3-methylbut-2-enyl diphosphate reductase
MKPLTVCAPLRVEARALRRGLRAAGIPEAQVQVVRTGYGPARSAAWAAHAARADSGLAVGGVGGALAADLRVGDIVVASQVSDGTTAVECASAPLLAGELRRAGLRVSAGPVVTVERLVRQGEHANLAASGAIAVDMESAPLIAVRAISDTPAHPVVNPRIVSDGIAALRSLRLAAPALARWAAALGPRRVLLASPRSFCAGVERAI